MAASTEHPTLTPSWKLVSVSIELVKKYLSSLVYLVLIPSLVMSLGLAIMGDNPSGLNTRVIIGIVVVGIGLLVTILNSAALYQVQLQATAHAKINLPKLYRHSLRFVPRVLGLGILVGLCVVGGLILLIVPGFIMFRRYLLAGYYLVDQDLSIREAMRRSAASSKPAAGYIWGIIGVQALFSVGSGIFGLLPGGIGAFVADIIILLVCFLPALRYVELRDKLQIPTHQSTATS